MRRDNFISKSCFNAARWPTKIESRSLRFNFVYYFSQMTQNLDTENVLTPSKFYLRKFSFVLCATIFSKISLKLVCFQLTNWSSKMTPWKTNVSFMFKVIPTWIWLPIVDCIVPLVTHTLDVPLAMNKLFACIQYCVSRTAGSVTRSTTAVNSAKAKMAVNCIVDGVVKVCSIAGQLSAVYNKDSFCRGWSVLLFAVSVCVLQEVHTAKFVTKCHHRDREQRWLAMFPVFAKCDVAAESTALGTCQLHWKNEKVSSAVFDQTKRNEIYFQTSSAHT